MTASTEETTEETIEEMIEEIRILNTKINTMMIGGMMIMTNREIIGTMIVIEEMIVVIDTMTMTNMIGIERMMTCLSVLVNMTLGQALETTMTVIVEIIVTILETDMIEEANTIGLIMTIEETIEHADKIVSMKAWATILLRIESKMIGPVAKTQTKRGLTTKEVLISLLSESLPMVTVCRKLLWIFWIELVR